MNEPLRFRPAARLQYLLSEQLVSDPNVAVLEFVKNAYDADATDVLIQFLLEEELEESSLIIADDGLGMDAESFEQNWMHPGYSEKVSAPPTSLSRIPVGEKGLGRLAAGRLGATLDVYSRRHPSAPWFHAYLRWQDFNDNERLLDEIPVPWDETSEPPVDGLERGTVIHIRGLSLKWDRRPPGRRAKGRATTRIGRLRQDLEVLLLPLTAGDDDFTLRLLHNSNLPEDAEGRIAEDGSTGHDAAAGVEGDVGGEDAPAARREVDEFEIGIVAPPRFDLLDYEYAFDLKRQGRGWRLVRTVRRSPDIALQTGHDDESVWHVRGSDLPADIDLDAIGPISGSFYYAPTSAKQFKLLRVPTGVRIYRDGVRVDPYGEAGDDWLGAAERKAVRQGHAPIQPNVLYGAITVSRSGNPGLRPLANREGFISNAALDAFVALCQQEFNEFAELIRHELLIPRWEENEARKASDEAISSRQWAVAMTRATAHAVRQPVTSAGAELLLLRKAIDENQEIPETLRGELRVLHEKTRTHLGRIDDAIGKMLEFLDVDPEPVDVDLVELIEDVVDRVLPDAETCGIDLRNETDSEQVVNLHIPAGLVEHALEELLQNAIQAARPRDRVGWVCVRMSISDSLRIDVSDNGEGIDDAVRKKLFTQSVSRTGRIGVGLLINRQLMQIARGDIELSGTGPEGSTFTMILPT